MKNLAFYFSVILLGFASCKKDDSDGSGLPQPSTSGKNFLACKVNGKAHVYSGWSSYMHPFGVSFAHSTAASYDGVQIYASGASEYQNSIKLWVDEDSTLKAEAGVTYYFEEQNNDRENYAVYASYPPMITILEYETISRSGWVRFSRLDSVASGTFEFTAYYNQRTYGVEQPDTVRVTEGRFDISRK